MVLHVFVVVVEAGILMVFVLKVPEMVLVAVAVVVLGNSLLISRIA